jgi:hypothetical protein
MKQIEQAIRELKGTVRTILLTQSFLDSLVVFSMFFLLFKLIAINWYWAIAPFFIYFIVHTVFSMRAARLVNIEAKVPLLYDNIDKDNEIVKALQDEVLKKMHEIRTSYFIGFGKLSTRLVTLIVLSFLIIFVAASGIQFIDINKVIKDLNKARQGQSYDVNASLLQFAENQTTDIYGNKSLAELGYEQLNIQINPVQSEIDINKINPPEQRQFTTSTAAEVGSAQQGGSYEESAVVKSNLRIVKKYFEGISKA